MLDKNMALRAVLCAATSHYEREGNVAYLYPTGDGTTMAGIMLKAALELLGGDLC